MGNRIAKTVIKNNRFIFGVSLATWVVTSSKVSSVVYSRESNKSSKVEPDV